MTEPMTDSKHEELCDRFDAAWHRGEPLRIEDLLSDVAETHRDERLRALLEIELEYRVRGGDTPTVKEYAERFPEQQDLIAEALKTAKRRVETAAPAVAVTSLCTEAANLEESGQTRRVIGPYKLLQQIGEGGMGTVYMAEQVEPVRRRVALKVVKSGLDRREVLARFEAERQALAMMNHPNIAKVLDAGSTDDGRPFFVMELVHGIPITDYCDHQTLSLDDRLQLFVQACRAIQHAHQKGIIHRDIKPSNVLVTQHDGVPGVKVIDFGLAKALQNSQRLTDKTLFTEFGQVVGTLQYMSPEQSEMNALDVDTRSDVYSLGVLLYELLTGSTPITREKIKSEAFGRILALIRDEEPQRPSTRLSKSGNAAESISIQRRSGIRQLSVILKGELDWIALKALEKDRARRYDTPVAMADDIRRFMSGEAVEARPPSFHYKARKAFYRHRTEVFVLLTILGILVAGIVGTSSMWLNANRVASANAELASQNEKIASRYRILAEKAFNVSVAEKEARETIEQQRVFVETALARTNLTLATTRWNENRVIDAKSYLANTSKGHRHIEWRLTAREFEGSYMTCYGHASAVTCVATHPFMQKVATGGEDGTIRIWDSVSGIEANAIDASKGTVTCLAFNDSGTELLSCSSEGYLQVWNAKTGKIIRCIKTDLKSASNVAFCPLNNGVVVVGTKSINGQVATVSAWDTDTGKSLGSIPGQLAFIPADGESIFVRHEGGDLFKAKFPIVHMTDTFRVTTLPNYQYSAIKTNVGKPNAVVLSPNRRGLLISGTKGLCYFDFPTFKFRQRFVGHRAPVRKAVFSPDGQHIATASRDGRVYVWESKTARMLSEFKGHIGPINDIAFINDGRRVVSSGQDGTLKFWDLERGQHQVARLETPASDARFSPDGSSIGVSMPGGDLLILDRSRGERKREFLGQPPTYDSQDPTFHTPLRVNVDALHLETKEPGVICQHSSDSMRYAQLGGHLHDVSRVDLSPDGSVVVSGGHSHGEPQRNSILLWGMESGELIQALLENHRQSVVCLRLSSDGKNVAAVDSENQVYVWNTSTGDLVTHLEGVHSEGARVTSIALNSDGSRLLCGCDDGKISLFDSLSGEELRRVPVAKNEIYAVDISNDESCILAAAGNKVFLWETALRPQSDYFAHSGVVTLAKLSKSGDHLYTESGPFRKPTYWNLKLGTKTSEPDGQPLLLKQATSGNGRSFALKQDKLAWVVDNGRPEDLAYLGLRSLISRPTQDWHILQSQHAASVDDWFAATWQYAFLLKQFPGSRTFYDGLREHLQRLDIDDHIPPFVIDALAIPKPPFTEAEAYRASAHVWKKVCVPGFQPKLSSIETIQEICRDFPRSSFLTTLGLTHYRNGNFNKAIDAFLKSISLAANERELPAPNPVDLAFLAMSYQKLGDTQKAAEYKQEFLEAMQQDAFRNDEECLSFANEMEDVL